MPFSILKKNHDISPGHSGDIPFMANYVAHFWAWKNTISGSFPNENTMSGRQKTTHFFIIYHLNLQTSQGSPTYLFFFGKMSILPTIPIQTTLKSQLNHTCIATHNLKQAQNSSNWW